MSSPSVRALKTAHERWAAFSATPPHSCAATALSALQSSSVRSASSAVLVRQLEFVRIDSLMFIFIRKVSVPLNVHLSLFVFDKASTRTPRTESFNVFNLFLHRLNTRCWPADAKTITERGDGKNHYLALRYGETDYLISVN